MTTTEGEEGDLQAVQPRVSWELRFRSPRHTLPAWAKQNSLHCVFIGNASGTSEVYAWDRKDGSVRQVTKRQDGTQHCAVDASGHWALWFADTAGDEFGVWMRQPFNGGPDEPLAPSLPAGWQAGLAIGMQGYALIGLSTEADGTTIHVVDDHGKARTIYQHEEPAFAVDLSRDLSLVVLDHGEGADARNMGIKVLESDGTIVADFSEVGQRYSAVGFSPVVGDARLLGLTDGGGHWEPFVYDARTGRRVDYHLGLPGDIDLVWCQDARGMVVHHDYNARSELYHYAFDTGTLTPLDVPPGTIEHVRTCPDGSVWYIWSSSAKAPRFCSTTGHPGLVYGSFAPDSVPVEDAWVDGDGGPIHALITRPRRSRAPTPTVFLLHGGPDDHDKDRYDPESAAWVDHGFTVVRVNYRGSTGYGKAWSDAIRMRVGLTELQDVDAVRRWAISTGVVNPRQTILAGSSWGGYLTLLGLGTQPGVWAVGLADVPIGDYPTAYTEAMEEIKALDRALFGGTPNEVPSRYAISSPLTYAAELTAPVFISAGMHDPRCPMGQVENYVSRLRELGKRHKFYRYSAGHESAVVDEQIELFARQLAFVRDHLPA